VGQMDGRRSQMEGGGVKWRGRGQMEGEGVLNISVIESIGSCPTAAYLSFSCFQTFKDPTSFIE